MTTMITATKCQHIERKHFSKGLCNSCYQVQWMQKNPNSNTGNTWSKNNPEAKQRSSLKMHLKRDFGVTIEDYEKMWYEQEGKCGNPACSVQKPLFPVSGNRRLHIDHDHRTGQIRGLLCHGCNTGLGNIGDSVEKLEGLINYLKALN